jgi:hypothetical protein
MTHEETMVRTAYAKFAYLSEQRVIGDLAIGSSNPKVPVSKDGIGLTAEQRLAAAQVSFTLSSFVVGDVRDILDRKAVDLISPAVGEMLTTNGEDGFSYSEAGLDAPWLCLEVQWSPARPLAPEIADIKLDDLYQLEWRQNRPDTVWQRYASYSVTVTYRGKSRGPYKALFLFGHDATKGNEVIEPEDATTNGLVLALRDHLFPDAFVLTRLRNNPVVANWVSAKQMSAESCPVGQHDVCCDLAQLKCGPGRVDVANGLAKPLPQ